jgi:hypothetical protein
LNCIQTAAVQYCVGARSSVSSLPYFDAGRSSLMRAPRPGRCGPHLTTKPPRRPHAPPPPLAATWHALVGHPPPPIASPIKGALSPPCPPLSFPSRPTATPAPCPSPTPRYHMALPGGHPQISHRYLKQTRLRQDYTTRTRGKTGRK